MERCLKDVKEMLGRYINLASKMPESCMEVGSI